MNFFLVHSPEKNPEDKIIKHLQVPIYEPQPKSTEGNKLPGDVIPVKYQPLIYTEECVAAGCPEGMW